MNSRAKVIFCTAICFMAVLIRLWLVAKSEVSDDALPDDTPHYLNQIEHPFASVTFPPGTGFFGRLLYEFGIPFRLGIEALFILACYIIIKALITSPNGSYVSCVLFIVSILNPNPTAMFRHLLSDDVWLVLVLLGLAILCMALQTQNKMRWGCIILSIICLGFSTITRTTIIPISSAIILTGIFYATSLFKTKKWDMLSIYLYSIAPILIGMLIFYYSICYFNLIKKGYFGTSFVDSSQYNRFYMTLQSVGDATGYPYYPVDQERRSLIAKAGPASQALMNQLDGDVDSRYWSKIMSGRDDITLGMFHWSIYLTNHGDYIKCFRNFQIIENEISAAAKSGRLKTRFILPLPDCRLNMVASALPRSLDFAISCIIHQQKTYSLYQPWNTPKLSFTDIRFSKFLTRRHVEFSRIREVIGAMLCIIYSYLYTKINFYFYLATVFLTWAILAIRWNGLPDIYLTTIRLQIFNIFFMAIFLWYALFDASGCIIVPRYLISCNVLLPILLMQNLLFIYRYLIQMWEGIPHLA